MDDLVSMLDLMGEYWRSFYNGCKVFREWFKCRFLGGIRSIEIKRGSEGWHVHCHLLLITDKSFSRDFYILRDRWKKVTNGLGSVWIKKARNYKVVVEVVKYITNIEKLDIDDLEHVYYAVKGRRLINTYGILRGIDKKIESELDSCIDDDIEFVCRVCGFSKYVLESMLFRDDLMMYDLPS